MHFFSPKHIEVFRARSTPISFAIFCHIDHISDVAHVASIPNFAGVRDVPDVLHAAQVQVRRQVPN